MKKIVEFRRRLAALTTEGVDSHTACLSLRGRLRELKREVLSQLLELRAEVHGRARKRLGSRLSLRELWDRRAEGARKLLAELRDRVPIPRDDKSADVVEGWAEINQEIDARLGRLAELEQELTVANGAPAAGRIGRRDDDLYAAVGAAVQEGARGGFCAHCGQGIEPGDRFCRRCGRSLR